MKFFCLILFLVGFAGAVEAHPAQCILPHQKIKPCDVFVVEKSLFVQFAAKEDVRLDLEIPGDHITKIKEGEDVRRNMMKPFVLGVLQFFSLFDKNKNDKAYAIDFTTAQGKPSTLFIQLNKKENIAFGTSLRKIHEPLR